MSKLSWCEPADIRRRRAARRVRAMKKEVIRSALYAIAAAVAFNLFLWWVGLPVPPQTGLAAFGTLIVPLAMALSFLPELYVFRTVAIAHPVIQIGSRPITADRVINWRFVLVGNPKTIAAVCLLLKPPTKRKHRRVRMSVGIADDLDLREVHRALRRARWLGRRAAARSAARAWRWG